MRCPVCNEELVRVDNPMRREIRHKRGSACLAWLCGCGQWHTEDTCPDLGEDAATWRAPQ